MPMNHEAEIVFWSIKKFVSYYNIYNIRYCIFTIHLNIYVIYFAYLGIWQTNCLRCIRIACQKYKQIETFNNCKPSLGGVCPNSMPPLRKVFTNSMQSLTVVCPKCMSCTIYCCELWPCSDEIKNDKNAAGKESTEKHITGYI